MPLRFKIGDLLKDKDKVYIVIKNMNPEGIFVLFIIIFLSIVSFFCGTKNDHRRGR